MLFRSYAGILSISVIKSIRPQSGTSSPCYAIKIHIPVYPTHAHRAIRPYQHTFPPALIIIHQFPISQSHPHIPHPFPIYCPLIPSSCLITKKFASKKRSTQFLAHVSSLLSSLPLLMLPVTHLVQQMSVRLWTAGCSISLRF